jgi:hypothetical protein
MEGKPDATRKSRFFNRLEAGEAQYEGNSYQNAASG